jgi:hypothetical protein
MQMKDKEEEKDPIIVKFARTVREATSYEEFFLVCMADDEMSALLDRLTACFVMPGSRCAEEISPSDLYKSLRKMVEDVEAYEGSGIS